MKCELQIGIVNGKNVYCGQKIFGVERYCISCTAKLKSMIIERDSQKTSSRKDKQ